MARGDDVVAALLLACAAPMDGGVDPPALDAPVAADSSPPVDSATPDTAPSIEPGLPPDTGDPPVATTDPDHDGDHFPASLDCDDLDPEVNPGVRSDACDGADADCDGNAVGPGACGEFLPFDDEDFAMWTGATAGGELHGRGAAPLDGGGIVFMSDSGYAEAPLDTNWGGFAARTLMPATGGESWIAEGTPYWAGKPDSDILGDARVTGDFDGDGNEDLAFLVYGQSSCCEPGLFVQLGPPSSWHSGGAYIRDVADGWWHVDWYNAAIDMNFGADWDPGHDVDGDGFSDIVVYARGDIYDNAGGYVFGLAGRAGAPPYDVSPFEGMVLTESRGGDDDDGDAVRVGPDIDGDGLSELLANTPWNSLSIYDISGAWPSGAANVLDVMATLPGEDPSEDFFHFPNRHATLGDLTGDGLEDPTWYRYQHPANNDFRLCLEVADAAALASATTTADAVFASACEESRSTGAPENQAVSDFDVDGDGLRDVLYGSSHPFDYTAGASTGVFGWLRSGLLSEGGARDISEFGPWWLTEEADALSAADLDADGYPELVVSHPDWDSDTLEDVGRVAVIPGFDIPYDDPSRW